MNMNKIYFTVVRKNGSEYGRYSGGTTERSNPSAAAKKAATGIISKQIRDIKSLGNIKRYNDANKLIKGCVYISIRRTTSGENYNKVYNYLIKYHVHRSNNWVYDKFGFKYYTKKIAKLIW